MANNDRTCRCPVCGQWYLGEIPVRAVKIWKDLVKDEHITVLQAQCRRCGFLFEAGVTSAATGFRGSPYLLLLVTVTLLASLMDGFMSLHLFRLGAVELNPLLGLLLEKSPAHFVILKYLMTSFGVVVFALLSERRLLSTCLTGRHALVGSQALFAGLILYQSTLLP